MGESSRLPHILFHGHCELQPADPLGFWESPPSEPQIRRKKNGKDRIFACGVCDDKGQLMTFLEASRIRLAVHGKNGKFAIPVFYEGVKPILPALRKAFRDFVKARLPRNCKAGFKDGGGSIAVVESFKKTLGVDSPLVGFARIGNNIHSPNEKYDIECYRKGIRTLARIFSQFAT